MADETTEIQNNEEITPFIIVPEPKEELPEHYLIEFNEAFSILDDEETNTIPTMQIFKLMRMLGTPGDMKDHMEIPGKYDPDKTGYLDYNSCLEIMTEKWANLDPVEELTEAFLQFDDGFGYIKEKDLRTMMTTLGNPLNKMEITKFMKEADINAKGLILWGDYVHLLNPNQMRI